ncbi:MAG: TonB-dependent receptor [Alphaproteobacteria bacterium]|jgi:iron complex outermembrane receptor protein|nr:TonB-dependent receptor [Alphaproteobacteria bacterium]MBT4910021.1 TonB-dependent receptor [Alphaproteobacteria bacterium]MBT5663565.1 TonB-dependent receptor [Alphaproteobacteria bacterium]
MTLITRILISLTIFSIMFPLSFSVSAQEESSSLVIEEIIVTARKRDESIQDVPEAVTAIAAQLRESSVRRIDDIQNFAPNLIIGRSPGIGSGAGITIRGISTLDVDKSLEPPVGVVMDGMFLGTASGVLLENFDIERIEVLRGPQGTLFGKNTTGGVLNIIRTPVTMEYGADISMTIGDFGRQDFKAVINVPIIEDKMGLKIFGASIQSDGHVYNSTLKRDVGGDDKVNLGFAAQWEPNENLSIKLHHEIMNDQSEQGAYVNRNTVGMLACTITQIGFDPYNGCEKDANDGPDLTESDGSNFSDNEYKTTILTVNYDTENFLYTFISTDRDMDEQNMQDFDGSPARLLRMNYYNDWHQKSNEFRITSQFSDKFEFVAGIYDWEVDYTQRWDVGDLHYRLSQLGLPYPGYTPTTLNSNGQSQVTESIAIFFSGDWHINDKLTLTAGFRWTEEEKDFVGGDRGMPWDPQSPDGDIIPNTIPPLFNPRPYQGKWDETTPKIGIRYQPNDDLMFFASYSEGFKSGGFFGRQANFNIDPSYEPEYLKNIELGWKSTLMDGRMIFNGSIFEAKYEDKQESILIPVDLSNVATVVRNASSLDMTGLELELVYQISESWDIMVNAGFMDTEYADYFADLTGDQIVTDNSGLTPRNTPDSTYGATTSYVTPLGNGELKTRLSYRFRDSVESDASNNSLGTLDTLEDLSATISFSMDEYTISIYGRNLTDEREQRWSTIDPLTARGWWNEGTSYGIEFSASF